MDVTIERAIFILDPNTATYAILELKDEWDNQYYDSCQMACAALKKQIAKEPEEKTINNVKYPICPVCGRVLWGREYYCATCGQRVSRGE